MNHLLPSAPGSAHALPIALGAAVPLRIAELERSGGPTPEDWAFAQSYAQVLAEKGDRLLFKGGKPGESAELFNGLARALSVLAFVPGGVRLFGCHWQAKTI